MSAAFDWDAAHERLRLARQSLDRPRSPAEARRTLEERAKALARREEDATDGPPPTELLVFALASGRLAVEARHVVEAVPLHTPTRVPCTPAFLTGVINHRGRILPVVDVGTLLGRGPEPEPRHAIAVEAGGLAFAIAAKAIEETTGYALQALSPPPDGTRGAVRGVANDLVTVLDLDVLAADPRLTIDDGGTR